MSKGRKILAVVLALGFLGQVFFSAFYIQEIATEAVESDGAILLVIATLCFLFAVWVLGSRMRRRKLYSFLLFLGSTPLFLLAYFLMTKW